MSGSQRLEPKCTLDRLLSQGYNCPNSLRNGTGNFRSHNREFFRDNREFNRASSESAELLSGDRRISTALDVNSWHFCGIARSVDFPPLAEERVQRTSPAMRQN